MWLKSFIVTLAVPFEMHLFTFVMIGGYPINDYGKKINNCNYANIALHSVFYLFMISIFSVVYSHHSEIDEPNLDLKQQMVDATKLSIILLTARFGVDIWVAVYVAKINKLRRGY